jgi:hypothetical protein
MNPSGHLSSLSPADIRAAAGTHQELGPEYRDAVLESFRRTVLIIWIAIVLVNVAHAVASPRARPAAEQLTRPD